MELKFWGLRGTMPVSGKGWIKYGGHTPCASVETSRGQLIIIDAGTGLKRLGDRLMKEAQGKPLDLHILLTHFHLDHILGLPFFAPLYSAASSLTFYAATDPDETKKCLARLMEDRLFPMNFAMTPSQKSFKKLPEGEFEIGSTKISSCPLNHPQGSVAYRIQDEGQVVVFATDTEHPETGVDERLASFAREADILIYDAFYTPEEYAAGKQDWGHSTWFAGTDLAEAARVRNLCLSHFNPDHTDKQIDKIISLAREKFPRTKGAREEL